MKDITLDIWRFIAAYKYSHNGESPTYAQIGAAVYLSVPGVSYQVGTLIQMGVIETCPPYKRSIRLLKLPPEYYCPCCNAPLRILCQPSPIPGCAPTLLADCWTDGCGLRTVTLSLGSHALLTPEEIQSYARAQRRVKANAPI